MAVKLVAGAEAEGTRLDLLLPQVMPNLSRSQVQVLNRGGRIRVNGLVAKSGYRVRAGDELVVDLPPTPSERLEPEAIPVEVRYEDPYLLVLDKAAGMVVHPGAGNRQGTLVNALLSRYPDLVGAGADTRPGIVHRLDRLTSGLIVVARTRRSHEHLSQSFRDRRVRKSYIALVHGSPKDDTGYVDLRIRRDPRVRTRMAVHGETGRTALSEYRVVERAREFTLLEVKIRTGRTHQIRVHLSAIGHPVVGDPTYGEKHHSAFVRRHGEFDRYFLHASNLAFPHPASGAMVEFESSLPAELQKLWAELKSGRR